MQRSSTSDKFSSLGLVGSADVDTRMVTPRVPYHQVCSKDNHISGNGLSIWSKKESNLRHQSPTRDVIDGTKILQALKGGEIVPQSFRAWHRMKGEGIQKANCRTCTGSLTDWPTGGSMTSQSEFNKIYWHLCFKLVRENYELFIYVCMLH